MEIVSPQELNAVIKSRNQQFQEDIISEINTRLRAEQTNVNEVVIVLKRDGVVWHDVAFLESVLTQAGWTNVSVAVRPASDQIKVVMDFPFNATPTNCINR